MAVLLTTPADPGDSDAGQAYLRAKIYSFQINLLAKEIQIVFGFGDESAGVWTHGDGLQIRNVQISEADYTTLIAALSNDGETVYAGAERLLYQYLIDNGHLIGTIEV
jgi:hypothetical protein